MTPLSFSFCGNGIFLPPKTPVLQAFFYFLCCYLLWKSVIKSNVFPQKYFYLCFFKTSVLILYIYFSTLMGKYSRRNNNKKHTMTCLVFHLHRKWRSQRCALKIFKAPIWLLYENAKHFHKKEKIQGVWSLKTEFNDFLSKASGFSGSIIAIFCQALSSV